MLCSKIGGDCPHPLAQDDRFIFVMMPFKDFGNVYDAIQMAVEGIEGKEFKCMRADEKYTNFSIWCRNICKNIRKAKYLIVDTTGKNPNVFYELGFSHALENTKAILITQNVEDAPFDIADLNHIPYSPDNLKDLREKLQRAISELEKEEMDEEYKNKTSDEMIIELRSQLQKEEERASNYKKELHDSEERERKFKERIREIEAIKDDPVKEAKNQITKLEGTIAELKSELKFTEETNQEEIDRLNKTLKDKEEKLKTLEVELDGYKQTEETDSLSTLLLDATKKQSEAEKFFSKGYTEQEKGNYGKSIEYYTKAIELKPDFAKAYNNRGNRYSDLKDYDRAISDYNKAIELKPDYADAYNNRGICYKNLKDYDRAISDYNKAIKLKLDYAKAYNNRGVCYYTLKEYDRAISDYNKAIELNPDNASTYENLAELYIITRKFTDVVNTIKKALALSLKPEDKAECLYLECIAKKMLGMDVSECEKEFDIILKEDFETTWNFDQIESWLAETGAAIDADKRAFIIEKIELLKKHKN